MILISRWLLVLASIVSVTAAPWGAVAGGGYLVPTDGYDCLVKNIKAYESVGHDPVIVIFSLCPNADPAPKDLQATTKNALPPPPPPIPGAKNVITLTKAEITCIADGKAAAAAGTEGATTLDLSACP